LWNASSYRLFRAGRRAHDAEGATSTFAAVAQESLRRAIAVVTQDTAEPVWKLAHAAT
jgi:hypothetical protein